MPCWRFESPACKRGCMAGCVRVQFVRHDCMCSENCANNELMKLKKTDDADEIREVLERDLN